MKYPNLERFSKKNNFNPQFLINAYEIETEYHNLIINENDTAKRYKLYNDLYEKVHPFYNRNTIISKSFLTKKFKFRFNLFKKYLINKDFLDVGCGGGYFLKYTSLLNSKHYKLYGLDANPPNDDSSDIKFIKSSILDFNLEEQFDVVLLSHVLEHIAPIDLANFIELISKHIKSGGMLLIDMPHKNFGPWDVTRIIDGSNSGQMQSRGSHFFESSHEEVIKLLNKNFENFKSPLPFKFIRYLFPFLIINSRIVVKIEKWKWFNKFLKSFRYKGAVIIPMECTLFAQKK
jgi:2-polyprenyl-3-methyl-5-hydroxy-6-metoxy-1,4-benzoquinol methylase